ncbi:MAG: lysine biosynthesis protein LysX [Nitrososphaerales archaeon]
MKITMLYDVIRAEEKMLAKAAEKKNIALNMLGSRDLYFDLQKDYHEEFGDIVLQRCVSYFRSLHLTALLESKGIKVVNGLHEAFTAGNKMNSTLALINAGVPVPRTYLSFNQETALKTLEELGYPAVLKPTVGSWGRLIAIMKDPETAESILEDREHMFPIYQIYYLQEKVKRPPRDIRAFVIGDKVVAAIYRISAEGVWKTNTARGGRAENCPVTPELEGICLKAADAIGEGIFGVDLMETPDGLVVHEVNNTIEFRNTVPATGIDIPGLMLDYLVNLKR